MLAGQEASGTAVIRGRVLAIDTGLPLVGASVQVLSGETVRSGAAPRHRTDARGAFEIARLPAGAYRLIASPPEDKPMYLTTDRANPGDTAVIDLADDEVRDLVFALPRAGAIGGRIFDQFGQPIAGADVRVFARGTGGRLLSVPRAFTTAVSDDFGRYRTWGFAPGRYYVRVDPTPGGRATPAREGYVRTYYPNATSLADATPVRLATSVDLGNVDVQLDLTYTFQLRGTVLDVRGRPAAQAEVRLSLVGERAAGTGERQTTGADGQFTFSNLVPAEYELRATQIPQSPAGRLYTSSMLVAARPERVTIVGSDADNVALTLQAGGALAGSIETTDGGALPFGLEAVRVRALPAEPLDAALVPRMPAAFDRRSRFVLSGVVAPALLRLQGLPAGWFLRAVDHAGQDFIDTPIDELGPTSTLRLIVSDRGGALEGTVEEVGGRPAVLCDVRLFPDGADGPAPWASGLRHVLTDRQGRFQIEDVAPGAYLVLAADRQFPMLIDEEVWEEIRKLATAVSLRAQSRGSVELTLVAWPY